MSEEAYIPRNRLPEDYGEGERQYDMAMAALGAAENLSQWIGILMAAALMQRFPWWVAIIAGAVLWKLAQWPHEKRLQKASELWDRDRAAYSAALRSGAAPDSE